MSTEVSNPSGDRNEKIANAAKVIGSSKDRLKVFSAIYTGKKKIKTVAELSKISDISNRVRILQEANTLASEDIVKKHPRRLFGDTAYEKKDFYTHNKGRIMCLVKNKKKLNNFPTKSNPKISIERSIKISIPRRLTNHKQITIDDIDSFSCVRKIKNAESIKPMYEKVVKNAIKKIIGESGTFQDWGGESNDLFTTTIKINHKRISAAFAFKGKGTTGILYLNKMGKRGDQIQKLFTSPAKVFLVQYNGQIDQSILAQMEVHALSKSILMGGEVIYYGIIDSRDTARLYSAYPKFFK
jgi:hypothetical protein